MFPFKNLSYSLSISIDRIYKLKCIFGEFRAQIVPINQYFKLLWASCDRYVPIIQLENMFNLEGHILIFSYFSL